MSRSDSVHASVAREYGERIEEQRCRTAAPNGQKIYGDDELADLPRGLAEQSLGCGNPLSFTDVMPGETVLDLGCGAGLDLVLAARRVGPTGRVIGVDMTPAMVKRAREHVARAGLTQVEVREGLIENLPVEDASVDWVISNCVLSLSPDKPRVFREVLRVLKPGGRLLISDIVVNSPPAWTRWVATLFNPSAAQVSGEADYVAGLGAAGFEQANAVARTVYDRESLEALLDAEVGADATCPVSKVARGKPLVRWLARRVARAVAGRVASVRFGARRPLTMAPA